jgi:hypothetical protein
MRVNRKALCRKRFGVFVRNDTEGLLPRGDYLHGRKRWEGAIY